VRETLESIVIALVLACVFRAYVAEAFVIPTGSMAPTLLGKHLRVRCSQCGFRFATNWPDHSQRGDRPIALRRRTRTVCPMCHYPQPMPTGTRPWAGDRILVHKFLYSFRAPRRWDVVVFKKPGAPSQNYIKRLVGLPREDLRIFEGNVYVRPDGRDAWRIARKPDRPAVQRAVWQPVYDSRHVPLDEGKARPARRSTRVGQPDHVWNRPWVPDTPSEWRFGRGAYRFEGDSGRLRLDFERTEFREPPMLAYNQLEDATVAHPIEDVRLAASVRPAQSGTSLVLGTTARLDDATPARPLRGRFTPDGGVTLFTKGAEGRRVLAEGQGPPLTPGRAHRLELWYADQTALLRVDGETRARWGYELSLKKLRQRPAPPARPGLRITVEGGPVTFERVVVEKDLYHTARSASRRGRAKRGPLLRDGGTSPPAVKIPPDAFFCLGDNSPNSLDGRFWEHVDDRVRRRMFEDVDEPRGLVPRRLMIGPAFFVYYPGMHRLAHDHAWGPPNFGQMRFIH
jgi:signal peptidase I